MRSLSSATTAPLLVLEPGNVSVQVSAFKVPDSHADLLLNTEHLRHLWQPQNPTHPKAAAVLGLP